MVELIITEKPNAAKKVAEALADGKAIKENINKVSYYKVTHGKKDIIVACAVGHLYTVGETEKTPWSKYPVFDVHWVPTADVDKNADFSKKYLNVIKKLAKQATEFTVACDYDIEGEVIGLNVIKYACKQKDAARMKFSTLTKADLVNAYENKSKTLDWGQANAGSTRHVLDFYYGINLTRALTDAINKATTGFKVLSSGRVQGPALKIIVDKEKEIKAFIPVPYWQIELNGLLKEAEIKALHKIDKFWKKEEAERTMGNVKGAKEGKISDAKKKQFNQSPPVPFDLTSLQIEAYRVFKIRPKHTLDLAQNLYSEGIISYPRTSSQKLPAILGFGNVLTQLKLQSKYKELAELTLKTKLIPNEGKKTDDAHPAIYPTGQSPKDLNPQEEKLYDLIVKRFFSVFAEPATRETNTITIEVNTELFVTKGTVTISKGWHVFYAPYVKLDETELPIVQIGDLVNIKSIEMQDKETKPPKRYTQSSIISELEKKNLGTKATRANVVETLFARGYAVGDNNIEATELGFKTEETLLKYSPEILDEELTRKFEDEMEQIRQKKLTPDQVLKQAKEILEKIVKKFKTQQKEIGAELSESNQEAIRIATTVGKCTKCEDGTLMIRRGKFGRFVACDKYPDCKTTFAIPRNGIVKPTEKICEHCKHPMIITRQPRKAPQELCINPDCSSKETNTAESTSTEEGKQFKEEGMECPKCKEGKMMLRKSFYGQFLGCDRYPKCKTMMKIVEGKVDITPISPKPKTKKSKNSSKKTVKKVAKKTTNNVTKKKATKKRAKKTKKAVKSNSKDYFV